MRKCIITTSAFVGCCCTYFNNVSTHSASVLCVGMAMHALVTGITTFVCCESALLTRFLEAVSVGNFSLFPQCVKLFGFLHHLIFSQISLSLNSFKPHAVRYVNASKCSRMYFIARRSTYTLKDVVHDVWDETFCEVELHQLNCSMTTLYWPYIDGGWLYV